MGDRLGIFDIWEAEGRFYARRVTAGSQKFTFGAPIQTASRYELHQAMHSLCHSDLNPSLVEADVNGYNLVCYSGKYWALPISLGTVHLGKSEDRSKPGILVADSLPALRSLVEAKYSLVCYSGTYWTIRAPLGTVHLGKSEDRSKPGT
jgi:hypothetical protein